MSTANLINGAAYGQVIDGDLAQNAFRVDDEEATALLEREYGNFWLNLKFNFQLKFSKVKIV